ncbi:hypothetical protein J7I98_27095 [Streptomyces sp. ISL-98]|uniref:hypothetical protein n=1 Tax=Streptomyces sp. ISL-98 TaxID=2819192 RepID=UPI001BE5E512|nr:hypothetical protein [Streptomyces sp. ISL-98]MBT2509474.1 hypothetical protein [Streptomyces sp. ISL-98]
MPSAVGLTSRHHSFLYDGAFAADQAWRQAVSRHGFVILITGKSVIGTETEVCFDTRECRFLCVACRIG